MKLITLTMLMVVLVACRSVAAEPKEWRKVSALDAAEANQAAAADERYVYAIDNSTIARYDRKTGKRIGSSQGEAKHLNSGFLFKGSLYCAHSNYPRTPEQSEIKVLDPESMKLTTFHDFSNFGGSLTWAVHHEGHWWCNLAKYGKLNGETFLVKLDDQWREQGRWTYPPEVIAKLGSYSISGGLWLQDESLTTGHDHRVIYRLKLPEQATVLELIDECKSPFPGQGIALDPVSGGLIGIDRGKKQVIFAE